MSLGVVQLGPQHAGVIAYDIFKKGSVVYEFEGEVIEEPSRTSIQSYDDIHLEDDLKIASFINHKCKPNTRIEKLGKKRGRKIKFIALKNIEIGEQITFDYNTTEYKIFNPFKCDCHGKLIKGNYYETRKRI
mgnify:CR=1 FL=1|tara:strand:- start:78 stop:473 length:396 start_codon:yes stop_codon:yes gene_type:complete